MFIEVVGQTLPLFIGMAAGFAASWARPFRDAEPAITAFVFSVALPALLFTLTLESDLSVGVPWQFAVIIVLSLLVGMAVLWPLVRWSSSRHALSAMHVAMAGSFGNVAYLGIPVVLGVLGSAAGFTAVVGQLIHNLVFLVAYPVLAAVLSAVADRDRAGSPPLGATIRRATLRSPLLWSVAVGALVNLLGIRLPTVVTDATSMFAAAAAPAALFAIGLTLRGALGALQRGTAPLTAVALASVGKVVLLPAASALLVLLVLPGLDPVWGVALIVLAAMPTSASAFMLAGAAPADRQAVATITLVTNGVSMLSVPVIASAAIALLT
jgi:malonate transporter and related proteins